MTDMYAKVAVITRTKDRGVLLERAIKSVQQQTMGDFIQVIINDGGDPDVVNDLVAKYKNLIKGRVRVIHNKQSSGMEAASNKAIKSVDSTYVAIHDDDDSWHPSFLKETVEHMDKHGDAGVIAATDRIEERIVGGSVQEMTRERWMSDLRTLTLYRLAQENFAVPISFIYRRDVFSKIGYYDESLPVCGDWDFALRFMRMYDIFFLQKNYALAYYHQRPRQGGILGNSIFAGADIHERYRAVLENKFLREDLAKGSLGLGYLFNKRRLDKENEEKLELMINEVDRSVQQIETILVERTNYKEKIKRGINTLSPKLYRSLRKVRGR